MCLQQAGRMSRVYRFFDQSVILSFLNKTLQRARGIVVTIKYDYNAPKG